MKSNCISKFLTTITNTHIQCLLMISDPLTILNQSKSFTLFYYSLRFLTPLCIKILNVWQSLLNGLWIGDKCNQLREMTVTLEDNKNRSRFIVEFLLEISQQWAQLECVSRKELHCRRRKRAFKKQQENSTHFERGPVWRENLLCIVADFAFKKSSLLINFLLMILAFLRKISKGFFVINTRREDKWVRSGLKDTWATLFYTKRHFLRIPFQMLKASLRKGCKWE